jgi:hypothetical protein
MLFGENKGEPINRTMAAPRGDSNGHVIDFLFQKAQRRPVQQAFPSKVPIAVQSFFL